MAERNLDFREAKSKGLVAPNKLAEKEVIKLAGGESAFKPETWWNEQLTKQINAKDFKEIEGFRAQNSTSGLSNFGIGFGNLAQFPDKTEAFTITKTVPGFSMFGQPRTETITYKPVYKDVTIDVLKGITSQSKSSVQELQRLSGEKTASKKRLSRVTGGLLAGANAPALGETQSTGPVLGEDTMLGQSSMLGSRRRM